MLSTFKLIGIGSPVLAVLTLLALRQPDHPVEQVKAMLIRQVNGPSAQEAEPNGLVSFYANLKQSMSYDQKEKEI